MFQIKVVDVNELYIVSCVQVFVCLYVWFQLQVKLKLYQINMN